MKRVFFLSILLTLLFAVHVSAWDLEVDSPTVIGTWNYGGAKVELPNSTTLPATCIVGQKYQDTNAVSGKQSYACEEPGDNWVLQGDGAGSGSAILLDLGDDGGDDSVDLSEIATINDTNQIFIESAADKLLIDMSKNWPAADTTDALSADGANCAAGQFPLGVDAAGAVQDCTVDENTTYTAGGDLLDMTGTVFSLNEGVLLNGYVCNFNATGSKIECILNTDGDGDCFSGQVCLGGHTHSTYWDEDGDISADEISEGKINFSTACAAGNHYYLNGNDLACEANTTDTSANTECAGNTTYMDGEGNCDDISSVYEPVLTDKASLESTISDVTDFAEADGDVYTGVHDFGGATSTEIVNGATPTVDVSGEIAVDTTSGQLKYYDGTAERVLHYADTKCAVVENLAAGDDNLEIWMADDAVTIVSVGVHCRGTCTTPANISLEDRSGNAMTHATPTVSTGSSNTVFTAVTAANLLVAGEGLAFDVDNAVSPETDVYSICFGVIYTSD